MGTEDKMAVPEVVDRTTMIKVLTEAKIQVHLNEIITKLKGEDMEMLDTETWGHTQVAEMIIIKEVETTKVLGNHMTEEETTSEIKTSKQQDIIVQERAEGITKQENLTEQKLRISPTKTTKTIDKVIN